MLKTHVPLRAGRGRDTLTSVWVRALLLAIALLVAVPAAASARHGHDDEVRATGTCGGGAQAKLKVKADDGALEVEVEVEHVRSGATWRLALVQEGRIAWRGSVRARGGRFEVERRLRDLAGADRIRVTARGPSGTTCRAAATIAGD
ncbi:hypothetical protein DSM104299_00919 [Baekduia alba]|uniref:hypothetical protein n=1 Tax=Baekduia alba TaxID=2997333 RepID=UPI002341686D|nr:hypothetical protein [Baekduia alba]WCB92229.1 hypothetical protein DSM104299_00919 [Baekduia alba]